VKRGEIWTSAGGPSYAGKPRPVLIVQDDSFGATGSITICLLTSHEDDAPLLRLRIEPTAQSGLRDWTWAMVDKIATVPRTRLGKRIGALAPAAMRPVNQAMLVFLGLAAR
jgi:mRNA interferase MazF